MISRLVLGTVQFGLPYGISNTKGQVSTVEAESMIQFAHESGVEVIDTAIGYGSSEKVLGLIGISSFRVISKLPKLDPMCGDIRDWVRKSVDSSLRNLNIDSIYGMLLHNPSDLVGPHGESLAAALSELKSDGKICRIGISIYSPSEIATYANMIDFDAIQAPLNLIDCRIAEGEVLKQLKLEKCEIYARSVFLQGLLLMPLELIPKKFQQWMPLFEVWHKWLAEQKLTPIEVCLQYSLSLSDIDYIVIGADSLSQLKEIIKSSSSDHVLNFPNISSRNENLINPSFWPDL